MVHAHNLMCYLQTLICLLHHFHIVTYVVLTKAEFNARISNHLFLAKVPVSHVSKQDKDREEKESNDGLPQLNDIGAAPHEDDEEPEIGKDGEESSDSEHLDGFDVPDIWTWDGHYTYTGDYKQVESC